MSGQRQSFERNPSPLLPLTFVHVEIVHDYRFHHRDLRKQDNEGESRSDCQEAQAKPESQQMLYD